MTASSTAPSVDLRQARDDALVVLIEVASLVPSNLRADLSIAAYDQKIDIRLDTEDTFYGHQMAARLGLSYEEPYVTDEDVHHIWSGQIQGHRVRVALLVSITDEVGQ